MLRATRELFTFLLLKIEASTKAQCKSLNFTQIDKVVIVSVFHVIFIVLLQLEEDAIVGCLLKVDVELRKFHGSKRMSLHLCLRSEPVR